MSRNSIALSRRIIDKVWWSICALCLALVVAPVVWIIEGVVQRALPGWRWSLFTETSTGIGGGLENAIVGTLLITFGVAILSGLMGIGCGIYLAEFSPRSRTSAVLRGAGEILSGIPSIVFGYCGYLTLVVGLHWGFSLAPALIVLSLLVVPYIAKSTELALNQVPFAYREGAEALGMKRTYLLRKVVVRPALPGMLTGLIIALAISVGETAPLIYTANFNNNLPTGVLIHSPVGYLTYAAFTFYDEPIPAAKALASDASLILVVLVLLLILASRAVVFLTQKYSPDRRARTNRAERRAARDAAAGITR